MAIEVWSEIQICNDIRFSGRTSIILGETVGVNIKGTMAIWGPYLGLGSGLEDTSLWINMNDNAFLDRLNIGSQENGKKVYAISASLNPNTVSIDGALALFVKSSNTIKGENGIKHDVCFAIQMDPTNGAVTLRQKMGGEQSEIWGGYVTLFRPLGKGQCRSDFDRLQANSFYIKSYKECTVEIGKALTDFETRLTKAGL